jgi:putative acyl-CoA dehydrogenase
MTELNRFETHVVENQPYPIRPYNLWENDKLLKHFTTLFLNKGESSNCTEHSLGLLQQYGDISGDVLMQHGELANKHKPVFVPFDRYGRRCDHVDFHPSYHALMQAAMDNQVHCYSWRNGEYDGAHVTRAALMFMHYQAESGTACPLTMTHAAVPALKAAKNLPSFWLDKIIYGSYDNRNIAAQHKSGLTLGMGMTEKQGGSDVRRNTTTATKQTDGSYKIVGHKFFFSAPMCDGHLILAQSQVGLSCFLLPRYLENGELNKVRIQRLKDKLGDWSNASSEVEFQDATAYLVGEEGRGVPVILDMVSLTRLDCMIGSSALMRQSLVQAIHHVSHRSAFGDKLINQPLMRNVLADLALECAAATALTMRVAKAVDEAPNDPLEAAFARIVTAIGKFWICKRTPTFVNEAQECLGGIGYVEENPMPRYYRQAPLNSIWEGSGNVQCLDVLRALSKEPNAKHVLFLELKKQTGKNKHFDMHLAGVLDAFTDTNNMEIRSRAITEQTALALQAAILLSDDGNPIAQAFCNARLDKTRGLTFGTLCSETDFEGIINFACLDFQ